MTESIFELESDYIELIKLLKVAGVADTGGMAKVFVENGEVLVDGEVEFRKRRKIRAGMKVQFADIVIRIK